MNAERKFLFACLIFALVIYAIHAFGLFDLLTDLPHLQTLIRQSGLFGYSLYILLFIIATLFLLPGKHTGDRGRNSFWPALRDTTIINCRHAGLLVLIPSGALAGT